MSDALERLRKRQRPEVPVRDVALTARNIDTLTNQTSSSVDTQTPRNLEQDNSEVQTSKGIGENLENADTLTSRHQEADLSSNLESKQVESLKTKQSTMRLEAEISDRLQSACRGEGLSREVLIEALFLHCEADPQIWQSVIAAARQRGDYRQQIANQRRAHSMMQRFGESQQ